MLEFKSTPDREVKMEDFMSIDGKVVQIPAEFSASFGLRYMNQIRTHGLDAGILWLLQTVLGPENYQLFLNLELDQEQVGEVVRKIEDKVTGATAAPKEGLKSV